MSHWAYHESMWALSDDLSKLSHVMFYWTCQERASKMSDDFPRLATCHIIHVIREQVSCQRTCQCFSHVVSHRTCHESKWAVKWLVKVRHMSWESKWAVRWFVKACRLSISTCHGKQVSCQIWCQCLSHVTRLSQDNLHISRRPPRVAMLAKKENGAKCFMFLINTNSIKKGNRQSSNSRVSIGKSSL